MLFIYQIVLYIKHKVCACFTLFAQITLYTPKPTHPISRTQEGIVGGSHGALLSVLYHHEALVHAQ